MKLNKKGISLIVLVITIIVMIVLAAAIILSLSSSGIIARANEAKSKSDAASLKEAAGTYLAEYELLKAANDSSVQNKSAGAYIIEKLGSQYYESTIYVSDDGEIVSGLTKPAADVLRAGVQIGDIVIGYNNFIIDDMSTKTSGKETRKYGVTPTEENEQTVTRLNNQTWRYLGIDKEGKVMIVQDVPTDSEMYNKHLVSIWNSGGYVYGPNELNTVCQALYGTSKGTAVNMNMDHVNVALEYSGPKGAYTNSENIGVETIETLTFGQIAINEKYDTSKFRKFTPTGNKSWEEISKYSSDAYSIRRTGDYIVDDEKIKETVYQEKSYWLATTTTKFWVYTSCSVFSIRYVSSTWIDTRQLCCEGTISGAEFVIRPVVSLNSNVNIGTYTPGQNGASGTLVIS